MIFRRQEIPDHIGFGIVSFMLSDKNDNQIYQIDLNKHNKKTFKVKSIINVEPEVLNKLQDNSTARVYMNVSSPEANGAYIASQHIQLPLSRLKLEKNYLIKLTYQFEIPEKLKINQEIGQPVYNISAIDIALAYSNKVPGEMGFGEAIRVGTFLSTRIMVKK